MVNFSAICGLVSAGFFVIPAVRQEMRRRKFSEFEKNNRDAKDEKLAAAVANFMLRESLKWNRWDSTWIFLGLGFLVLSFITEIFH
jgi:hypothetical protein